MAVGMTIVAAEGVAMAGGLAMERGAIVTMLIEIAITKAVVEEAATRRMKAGRCNFDRGGMKPLLVLKWPTRRMARA
jgi:hypothetical protein